MAYLAVRVASRLVLAEMLGSSVGPARNPSRLGQEGDIAAGGRTVSSPHTLDPQALDFSRGLKKGFCFSFVF